MTVVRVLHLSDLHFGEDHFFRQGEGDADAYSLADAVAEVLGRHGTLADIDVLLLSGDFFSTDQANDLAIARSEIPELQRLLSPAVTLSVPGNHDVTWEPLLADDKLYFYDRLTLSLGVTADSTQLPHVAVVDDATRPVALVLLDSCRLEGREQAGFGRIGDRQLDSVREALDSRGVSSESHTIIAVLHHHLLPVSPMEPLPAVPNPAAGPRISPSLTVDAVEVLRQLTGHGVALVLHGHQHHRAVIRYENLVWGTRSLHVAAAGSCGAKGEAQRHFYLLDCDGPAVTVNSFCQDPQNPARFVPDSEFAALQLPI